MSGDGCDVVIAIDMLRRRLASRSDPIYDAAAVVGTRPHIGTDIIPSVVNRRRGWRACEDGG